MTGMTFEQQAQLYEMIERSVREHQPITFPGGIHPVLQVGRTSTGPTFTIPGLLWIDEQRNVYEAWMQMELWHNDDILEPGLFVKGSKCPDGKSSGDTSMFCRRNRYKTVI